MLYILDRDEKVVGILQSNSDRNTNIYYDDVLTEILSSGADTFTFTSISDSETSKKLTVGNYIAFKKGNKFKLLQIIEVNENKEDVLTKEIYCEGAGLELINTVYSGSKMESVNIKRFLMNILQDTNWNVGYIESNLTKTLSLDVEEKEVYSIIQEYLYDFEAEIDFRVEIKGNRITGRYVDVYTKRGKNNGRRLEINRDIKSISRKVSLTDYATKLIGEGKNGLNFRDISMEGEINKPLGQNFVVNEDAYSRINNKGKHITRKFTYDTEDAYELLRQTYKALKEYSEPKVTYEVDADILNFDDIEIGDYVSISDLSFTPPLLVTARISELETSKTNKYTNKAVLSNFNEVRSGITSIFPILGEDIVSGSIGEEQMNSDYVDSIISDSVNASIVKTEILLADKANISDLSATNAEVENLKVNKAEITDLNAANANIDNLKANVAEIDELLAGNITANNIKADSITSNHIQANSIDTKHLKADSIDVSKIQADSITSNHIQSNTIDARHINANSINSDHIQANTITSGHIQTGTITAGSGVIAEGAIGSAQISQIDAGKIDAGTIDTSKVTIQGSNGHLRLKGNRLQVFQGTGSQAKERVSVGDVNGNGTVYGLRVRGADGQTILLDENGVKSEGITDGSITNSKISDNAEIDGTKLNINSVVSQINKDGTEVIKGTKISVNGTNLETKLSTIESTQSTQGNTISQHSSKISANEKAIALKVDTQTYTTDKSNMTSQLEKNTSSIEALQGEIKLKVESTDVTNAINTLQVGGRNLAQSTSSNYTNLYSNFSGVTNTCPSLAKVLTDGLSVGDIVTVRLVYKYTNIVATSGQTATAWIQGSGNSTSWNSGTFGGSSRKTLSGSGEHTFLYSFTITENHLKNTYWSTNIRHDYVQSGSVQWKLFKVEKGNKATDWSPAPEDIVNEIDTKISSAKADIKLTTDAITSTIEKNYYTKTDIDNKGYQTSTQVNQTVEGLEVKVKQSGGYNLIRNSTGASNNTSCWTHSGTSLGVNTNDTIGSSHKTYMYLDNGTTTTEGYAFSTRFKLKPNTTYRFTGYFHNYTKCPSFDVFVLSSTSLTDTDTSTAYTNVHHIINNQNTNGIWKKYTVTFTTPANTRSGYVRIDNNGYNANGTNSNRIHWNCLTLTEGELEVPWSPHPSEVYDGITTIDKDGITVTSSNVKSKTSMTSSGFKITKTDTNEDVFKVNSDGTLTMKGNITVLPNGSLVPGSVIVDGSVTAEKIKAGAITAGMITSGTLDASKVTVTNLNASNIKSGKLSASYIDATNLAVKGELISGQINGVGGMKFADGAVVSSCESGVAGYKGIKISAPVIKLGDKVEIQTPTIFSTVTGKNDSYSNTTTWSMSSSGALTCASANITGTTTVGSTLNVKNNAINGMNNLSIARGSVNIPIFSANYTYDYIKGGASRIAFADSGPIHFLYNGTRSSFIAGGTIYLPHNGNTNCDHFRLGSGIVGCPSSGSFHFLTSNGATSPLYAGILYSATALSAKEPMVISNNSVFDKINSINVIETKNGLRLHNPISTIGAIDESTEVVKTEYNEEKEQLETSIDYTSAISTLWKAVQELKQENNELKEIIKSLCPKE